MSCEIIGLEKMLAVAKSKQGYVKGQGFISYGDHIKLLDNLNEIKSDYDTVDGKQKYSIKYKEEKLTVKKRVSESIKKNKISNLVDNADIVNYGSFGHRILELMEKGDPSYTNAMTGTLEGFEGFIMSSANIMQLKNVIANVHKFASKYSPDYTIRVEQFIHDPVADEGGTIDVLVMYNDDTTAIHDFKFQLVKNSVDNLSYSTVNYSKRKDTKAQLSRYKNILLERNKVKRVNEIVMHNIMVYDLVKTEDKITGKTSLMAGNIVVNLDRDGETVFGPTVFDTTTKFNVVDNFINILSGYIDKMKNGERRVEFEKAITKVAESNDIIQLLEIYRGLMEAVIRDIGNPDGAKLAYYEYKQLRNVSKFMEQLSKHPEGYKEILFLDDAYIKNMSDTILELTIKMKQIDDMMFRDVLETVGTTNVIWEQTEDGEIPFIDQDSMLTAMFDATSKLNNPIIQAIFDKVQDAQVKANMATGEFQKKLSKVADAVYKKYDRKFIANLMIDKEKQRLYNRITDQFKKDKETAKLDWYQKMYDITDYPKYYDKVYKEFQESLDKQISGMQSGRADKIRMDWTETFMSKHDLSRLSAWEYITTHQQYAVKLSKHAMDVYKTPELAKIEQYPEILAWYNFHEETMYKLNSISNLGLSGKFVPAFRKSIVEKLADKGPLAGLKEFWDDMFTSRVEDTDDITRVTLAEKSVPIIGTNSFENFDETSLWMDRSLLLFANSVFKYVELTEIEGEVLLLRDAYNEDKFGHYEMSITGNKAVDSRANAIRKKEGILSSKQAVNDIVDYYIYGISMQTNVPYAKFLLKLKNYLTLNKLGLGVLPAASSFLGAYTNSFIEGSKGQIYTNASFRKAEIALVKDRSKASAMYFFFDIAGKTHLKVSGDKHSKLAIGDKTFRKSLDHYISSESLMSVFRVGDELIDNTIAVALSYEYSVNVKTGVVRKSGNVQDDPNYKNIWEIISYKDGELDIAIPNEVLPDFMKHFKNTIRAAQRTIKGTMNSEDVARSNMYLLTNLMMQFKTWMPGVLSGQFGSTKYVQSLDVIRTGNLRAVFDESTRKQGDSIGKFILGTLARNLMQISKAFILDWNVRGFGPNTKWDNAKFVSNVNMETWFEQFKTQNPFQYKKMIEVFGTDEKIIQEIQKSRAVALHALVVQLRLIAGILATISFLAASFKDWDDDDELSKKFVHKLLQVSNRLYTETSFALNPVEFMKLLRGGLMALPSIGVDLAKLLFELVGEGSELIGFEGDKNNQVLRKISKIFPGIYQLIRLLDIFEEDANSQT